MRNIDITDGVDPRGDDSVNWDDMTHQERDEYVCEYAEVYDTEVSDHLDDATRDLAFGSEL